MKVTLLILLAASLVSSCLSEKVINCYWGTWANYRSGNGKFTVENINPNLCTRLSYSFFGINNDGNVVMLDNWLDVGLEFIKKAVALKKVNPKLKVIAAVGGWNEGSAKYSAMAADPSKRNNFTRSILTFISNYNFDGLDLDWEYPGQNGGSPNDKQNFVTLLRELKQALGCKLELSIAVAASSLSASLSYNIPAISQYVNYINVMTYDFSGSWNSYTGFNAPLYGNGGQNVASSIQYWLNAGAPAQKLVLGIGFYGRSFTLANSQNNGPGAASIGGGTSGAYTQESGFLGYNEICENINDWTVHWDTEAVVPYAVKGDQWVGYDNVQSINAKMDFLLSKNLAGATIWSIETDDFRGICGQAYPLLNAINNKI